MLYHISGYRHVRLRTATNQPLELATIFIYSKHEEELIEPCSRLEYTQDSTSAILKSVFTRVRDMSETGKDGKDVHVMVQNFIFMIALRFDSESKNLQLYET